jgi:hypothetical protein
MAYRPKLRPCWPKLQCRYSRRKALANGRRKSRRELASFAFELSLLPFTAARFRLDRLGRTMSKDVAKDAKVHKARILKKGLFAKDCT